MSRALTIRITRRAAAQIQEAAAWWADHRLAAPGAISEELERAFALLTVQPDIGARARNKKLRGVRRLHLNRIRHHLYYRVSSDTVEVLAFWHASRGAGPKL
ncbi:MAG: type II toxin-antitoxin system RelE/ParE family toxin [Gammaproteobacteria bacterium]|nr:type II toxin-antitoxin system RelE/ParE family toxin [Gammaproteobacteria bacterium]